MLALTVNPGQTVSLAISTSDGYGQRSDGYQGPIIDFVLTPSNSTLSGFPLAMTKITTGLFKGNVAIPTGLSAIGTYIVSVSWPDPTTSYTQYETFMLHVGLPFGASSIAPG